MRVFTPRLLLAAALAASLAAARPLRADPPAPPSGTAILQNLKSFSQMATVLMVAAHPDDENTQLITYLARGRGYRMGYLSVTRGDGGQNVLGGEFGPELGLIRTHELLAARNLDLGRQFFTRAIDFGFSKNPEETLKFWDRDAVLGDVVRVIREFRPDVVITRFSPTSGGTTHGHHTASAILALDAFKLSGDPKAYPEQLKEGLTVWQPKRILLNAGNQGATGTDPVLNESFNTIAAQSRAMHKSQGFGGGGGGGGGGRGGAAPAGRGGGGGGGGGAALGTLSPQGFSLLGGDPIATDIMDGIDTTWARTGPAGPQIAKLTADAIANFDPNNPSATVPALLDIKKLAATVPSDPVVDDRRAQLDRILADCLGLTIQTTVPNADVCPGEEFEPTQTALLRTNIPVRWVSYRYPSLGTKYPPPQPDLKPNTASLAVNHETLPAKTPVSQPYWLREAPDPGIYHVADPTLIGRPMNPPVFPVEYAFEVAGQTITLSDEPVQLLPNAPAPQQRRPLAVIAPIALTFASEVNIFTPGKAKSVDVDLTAYRPNLQGSLQLNAPAGWTISPSPKSLSGAQPFKLAAIGDHATLSFSITPPANSLSSTFSATATIGTQTYSTGHKVIAYDHLPRLLLQPQATTRAVTLDLAIKGKSVAYLPGAGDSVADCIAQMGYTVTQLKPADLTEGGLKQYDAVVLGVRAFNTRDDLGPNSPALKALFDYAAAGGTVVEQYSRPDGPGGTNGRATSLAPFPIHLSALRVTDESAKVTFLAPDSPALNTPNKITEADFANWVQERNIYLPDNFGPEFKPILAMADPGENPPNSSLLIAPTGKGYFVYTSLVFFRQLPAGNPGAYRLFANLLSLGKP